MKTSETASGEQSGNEHAGDEVAGRLSFAQALAQEVGDEEELGSTGNEGAPGERGEKPKAKPKNLNELAERLGVEVSELYDVAVPAGHGREAMTLGSIKDRYDSWAALESDRLALTETRVQQEAELTRGRAELQELLSMIPRDKLLNTEVLQRVAARVAERTKAQDAQVLAVIPEWKDEAVQTAERGEIAKLLEGYGLTAPEVKAIRNPGLVRFMRDAMRREKQVRAALAQVRQVKRKPVQQQTVATGSPHRQQQPGERSQLKPQTGRERFSEVLRQEGG